MKLSSLAALLALLPAPALANLGNAPTVSPLAVTVSGPLSSAKDQLFGEIEAWRATQLPHTNPPSEITVSLEPRLDEIKADVRVALLESDLAKPRKDLDAWKQELLRQKYALAQKQGLARNGLTQYSKEQTAQAEFSAKLHSFMMQDAITRSVAAASTRVMTGAQDPAKLFDGARPGGEVSDGAVSAGAPVDAKDPARYAKVRQILLSQGASARVVDMAIQEAIRQNADPLLVLSVINAESGFDTHATSYKRDKKGRLILDANGHKILLARGLMQIIASTGRGLGVHDTGMLYDAQTNLRAGITFLKSLVGRFSGGVRNAVAAYNAGPGAVDKYNGVPPYRETQGYVKNVLGYYARLKQYVLA